MIEGHTEGVPPLPAGAASDAPLPGAQRVSRRRRIARRFGTALLVAGALLIVYGAIIYFWRDPVTDLYARWKQHQLAAQIEKSFASFKPVATAPTLAPAEPVETGTTTTTSPGPTGTDPTAVAAAVAAARRAVAANARAYAASVDVGDPLGRILIPRLGIDPVFVNGTRWTQDLSRGPGRYPETSFPGVGKVTAIAGHRTTFGAPFRHIDRLRSGDTIILKLPYGTFHYSVYDHQIVDNGDWSVIRPHGFDELVLSACHPLYSASHRWIVYARLVRVDIPGGGSYTLPRPGQAGQGAPATGS